MKKRRIVILITFLIIICVIICCILPLIFGNSNNLLQGSGYSNEEGIIIFEDSTLPHPISILTLDSVTTSPIPDIRVEILSNRKYILIVAYDEKVGYLPAISEYKIINKDKPNYHPGTTTPIGSIAMFLDLKSNIQTKNDLNLLEIKNPPHHGNLRYVFFNECWTHDQLRKKLGASLEGVQFIFPIYFGRGPGDQETEMLWKALLVSSGKIVDLDTSDYWDSLPEPILISIYQIPITTSSIALHVMGECKSVGSSTPTQNGMATLFVITKPEIIPIKTILPTNTLP